jgi:hypothetical protein
MAPELMHTDGDKASLVFDLSNNPMALVALRASMVLFPSRHAYVENRLKKHSNKERKLHKRKAELSWFPYIKFPFPYLLFATCFVEVNLWRLKMSFFLGQKFL